MTRGKPERRQQQPPRQQPVRNVDLRQPLAPVPAVHSGHLLPGTRSCNRTQEALQVQDGMAKVIWSLDRGGLVWLVKSSPYCPYCLAVIPQPQVALQLTAVPHHKMKLIRGRQEVILGLIQADPVLVQRRVSQGRALVRLHHHLQPPKNPVPRITANQQSNIRSSGAQPSAANHTNSNSPAVHSEDRRPLAICVRNLPARSSDTSLKDGLYHEYKKHGKVTWVKVVGQGVDRYALVSFKKPEDVDKALQVSHDKLFFGCKIEVAPYQGYDVDDNEFRPFEAEQDEFHPKATRTLFIGNLDKDITTQEIRKHFDQFGEIIDIDIKKQGTSSSYAFCQFSDIGSVVRAMRSLDGEHVGNSGNRVKLGFGKSMHTSCVWVDGVAETVSEKYLSQQFGQFGPVSHVVIDRARGQALVSYEQITYAQQAVKEMRGAVLRGRKLQVDYASRECQESFYDHMEKQSSSSTHPPFENSSSSVAGSPQNLRVFESPSSSTTAPCTGTGNSVTNRYNSCSRYSTSRSSSYARSSSPSRSRHSSNRFQDYPSSTATGQEYERRPSYRSYEDMTQVEENNTPSTGTGDIRHLQKERVSLLEQLEDCTSSGEEGTNRRRCNKHRRSQSGESSRPGTPLCDERPENLGPVEPRRPRESRPPDPLSLPLPRFASQVLSPRPAPPSPPASPQTHSSSSDSEPSPEWEERLRSLDEKYEKWSSGSRAGLTKVDLSTLKVRHKLLELDLHELQPSEIVKSVLAKRSVFDEDSKRLENFGEKYEPREFVPARPSLLRGRLDLSPMSSPIVKSPSSPAAKGLQYPFPSHPPVQPTTSVATTTAPTSTTVTVAATEIKPTATTFLTNCTPARQFPLPKISSPQAEKCESNIRLTCTKVLPSAVSTVKQATVPCKPPLDIKKEQPPPPLITKVKTNTPVRRESSDDKKDESRRKSRDESVESVKSGDSVKREDTSECDKVRDSQITERRKSISEKRRSSSEHKEINCERSKDPSEKRRGSSETESETNKRNENKKSFEENHIEMPKLLSEPDKISRKIVSDSIERRKETESNIRPNGDQEKKKDVFGVNSEKDRRRNRESIDTSDNPKHSKKVPDIKKEVDSVDKRDKDEDVKVVELDKKKETCDQSNIQNVNRHKEKKDHQDRRRDSSEHSEKKSERISPENSEVHRIKDKKANHDLSEPRNSKKQNEENEIKVEIVKHKDSERRKNSENEISKEHSLFKKVFGFAERTYGHHKDRRDSDSTAVKTDDTIKHRRDHSEKDRKRDKDSDHSESSSSSKHKSRKSPDQPENNRHKERKRSESSEKRIRKELEQSDDHKQKSDHLDTFHSKSRERKEERSSKESSKNVFHSEHLSDINTFIKHNDRRKDPSLDESRNSESDSNDLKLTKDGESKKDNEMFFERRKEESAEGRSKGSNERRKDSVDKYFDNDKYTDRSKRINDESDLEKKNDSSSDIVKYKHERHRDNDRKRDLINIENCRTKEPKEEHRQREEVGKHKDERKSEPDLFDCLKSKDENYRYRDYSRKKDNENQEHIRITEKKKEEKDKKKDRESQDSIFKVRDSEDKSTEREIEKLKRSKEFDLTEGKVNGDHDDYCLESIDYRKPNFDEEHHAKKEKRKERSNWPATIGCKRRLSSQDSLEIVDDAKRSKPERRDSKDSGRSSGSSRKSSSEKHKGFTKLLEEKIKEDKEREQRKKEDSMIDPNLQCDDKMSKPAIRKEKRNSGEKRKEERKFKSRPRENGTASESDLCSGDEEAKANKRQHSIFDIVDDEPAYISMYDKVKARSTKNMQKQEEEKRQEKLKEKFHQLKASRAKREEKKRSTSYDEDSDSEKGGSRRSNKLLITSSEDEACSENDVRVRTRKVLCDTSEDDTITTPRSRSNKYSDYETKSSRKIISDISEDDSLLKHSTPKIKSSRNISFESDMKTRKIMSDTSEDDSTRQTTPRQKPSRIQSDDSEGDLGFEDSVKTEPIAVEPFIEPVKITDVFTSRPVEMNHFASNDHDQKQLQLQSSPETLLRMPLCNSVSSEQPRKKNHKKKAKKKNYEVSEDGTIIVRKHSSKKEKKKSHRDDDDEKKSRKKKSEREGSSNKREEKFEDIFGPLSDDSEKAAMSKWQVSQVYGSDSESERENIRKKEKKRKEKKLREQLDEAGRALEAKLLDTSEDITEEPVKTKKKKRKKSRDEKIKHHRIIDEETLPPLFSASIEQDSTSDYKRSEAESVIKESEPETKQDTERETDVEKEDEESKMETDFEENVKKEDISLPRQHSSSLSSLLDSPPAQLTPTKKPDIPGFGTEVDETIHETAVKSISESTIEDSPLPQEKFDEKPKQEDVTSGDKPTPIISQEETEDAVAALLMEETFGSSFERYSDDTTKPDTPVSEPDLQIDTDTEDTFDPIDFSKATKSPETANVSFCPNNDTREGLEERIMSLACSTESSLKEQEKTQSISTDVKKDPPSDKTDSETEQLEHPSEKPAIIKSPVIENNKSDDPLKSVTKDPIPKILNEDKPIEIDDDEDEELETSKSDKNSSSDKLETSNSSLETVKSAESIEMSDKVIKIDVKEVQGNKHIDNLSHTTLLTQSVKHQPQLQNQQKEQLIQQQEHIRLQPQLQNQQKEQLIQQQEPIRHQSQLQNQQKEQLIQQKEHIRHQPQLQNQQKEQLIQQQEHIRLQPQLQNQQKEQLIQQQEPIRHQSQLQNQQKEQLIQQQESIQHQSQLQNQQKEQLIQQQEHIRHQPQLQNQQKEQLIQQQEPIRHQSQLQNQQKEQLIQQKEHIRHQPQFQNQQKEQLIQQQEHNRHQSQLQNQQKEQLIQQQDPIRHQSQLQNQQKEQLIQQKEHIRHQPQLQNQQKEQLIQQQEHIRHQPQFQNQQKEQLIQQQEHIRLQPQLQNQQKEQLIQQQEHIRLQPQLQNQQKEQLIQQKEVLQKPPLQQLQKSQQPQQPPSLQPQLPLPSKHQPQAPQQLQSQHHTQQQVQTQHQTQQPVQSQHQTQHPVLNQHHTQQPVQSQHHSQHLVQSQHHTQQPMQTQHQTQLPVQTQHHSQHSVQSHHQVQQSVQNLHHSQQPVQNQHQTQHPVQNQNQTQHPVQNPLQPQLPMLQKQPIQPQQFQHQQLQKQQQSHPPQQLHHSQHQPHLHQQQIHQQQQVIKPVLQEKSADQPTNAPSVASTNFQKSEKIIHQQVMPQHHNTVLVHQAQAQPQTAQVVKPLSVQVINSPVIKSLDQSVLKHTQPHPKLNSPPVVHAPQTTATASLQSKPPLHHISPYQGRMPNPLPHLIPPHLPVKPTGQMSLQTPQLTPLVKAGLATSPRPLVHTIQNPQSTIQNQKQLHVVTQNLQHSPQPPVSPQNLKVIRPVQNPNIRSPMPQQQSPIRPPSASIPLLQTVNTSDATLNKQYHVRPPQHLPNTHLLQCSPSQVPHPEKVMNLSPSLPIQSAPVALTQKGGNVSTIKTNEIISKSPFQPENSAEKQNNIRSVEFNTNAVQESMSVLQSPKIQVNSIELPNNENPLPLKKTTVDEVQQIRPPLIESKPNTKTNIDENKPLNAVIQDLTLKATNKVLGNTHPNTTNMEIKSETPRPIDQVVRELQLRKKSISAPEESEKPTPINETKVKEENEESNNDVNSNTNSSLKQEEEEPIKKEPLLLPDENKKSDELVKTEVKEEKRGDEVTTPKEESKIEKEEIEIPKTPPNAKLEVKQQLSPHNPDSKTPKSSKELEQDIPSSDERVIPSEKSIPPSGSGRGRGGRRRKLGRGGASGVTTRRGGRHATAVVSSPAPPARPQVPADVYEFRDDSEEERPRLILTIKPEQPSQSSSSIVPSTRKSRRLQEKDGTRTMIDDSVEELIIRGPGRPSRRATRSTAPLLSTPVVETTRKSPRRKQAVASQPVRSERSPTPQPVASPQNPPTPQPGVHTQQPTSVPTPEPPAAALVSPSPQAPVPPPVQPPPVQVTQLVPQKQPEPEVVVLAPQQPLQKEPPKLLSPPRTQPQIQSQPQLALQQQQQQQPPVPPPQQPIISQAQQIVKPIHKLTPLSKPEIKVGPIMQQRPGEPTNLIDPVTGLLIPMREGEEGQYIPVGGIDSDAPPEKRMRLEDGITKAPVAAIRPSVVRPPQQAPHAIPKPASPPRLPQKPVVNSTIPRPPKAHLLQAVAAERAKMMPRPRPKLVPPQVQQIQAPKPPTPMTPKAHILQAIGSAAQAREGVIGSAAPHQGSILTGSVASPPLRVHPQPMVTGASSTRFVERAGGRLAAEGGCIVVPSASPQPPPRGQVMQAGLPVPAYEASLHGVVAELLPNPQWPRQQSPPPAHQHSTQTQGDVVQHVSGYGHHIQPAHYVHPQLMYQQYLREAALGQSPYHRGVKDVDDPVVRGSPPLELRRRASPHDRTTDSPQVATLYGRPHLYPPPPAHRPAPATRHQVATPPHASQRYPVMWQGLLALKNDQAAVQMHFVFGNPLVARDSLPCNSDGSTPPLRISQRMRLEQTQLDGVARKMQMDNEHCMLLALPCGRDHMDVLQQSNNLQSGFITYLQQKQAAGIVNIAAPGSQQAAYVVHIFPASEFANDSLARIAPDLLHRVTDIAHLLIVIATV
ncbi:unnamed protein product [Nezara viridula]|uniref:Protein split ends n=1 Tax=Nezara viridula TaxID=85310 RepID=A0A9P0HSI6_NEZVI|nr:unnamed protein product [Nezara viridula]